MVLKAFKNDLHEYLLSQQNTYLYFGSEFRPVEVLRKLLHKHPTWQSLENVLLHGAKWPLSEISESDRIAKNAELISRGNHKSALKYETELHQTLIKEVAQGWMVPFPLDYISSIQHGELAPVGMDDKQWTELPNGKKKVKLRLTHDQSFNVSSGKSVNDRVLLEELEPLYYGGCLSRVIHYIISVRLRHPRVVILGGKSDIKAAYRRITLHGDTAAMSTIMFENLGCTSLRLTFGGSPCPNYFCLASETCTDLTNDILHCPDWDPGSLSSPHATSLRPPEYLDESIKFARAQELDVEMPVDDFGRADDFIDDGIVFTPDIGNNSKRALQAMLLAIHIIFRPVDPKEPIQRDDCLSLGKLNEEGFLSETPVILGWLINTRTLTIHLPEKKFKTWNTDLSEMISSKKSTFQELEKLLGRLNHTASACPLMRYFLNRIRKVLQNWGDRLVTKKAKRYLASPVIEDLKLWHRCFLPKVYQGLSLNLITYRRPTIACWSDACPQGMGGFDTFGNAWQYKLSTEETEACTHQNNSLEFVASLITVWLTIDLGHAKQEECFLALGDNTSAVSWLHKANIDETKNLPLHMAARQYANVLMQADCCLYSQHIAGKSNIVADILSRRFNISHRDLSTFILNNYPKQVPASFTIYPLPPKICSWLTSWLQKCREKWESQKGHEIKKKGHGIAGPNTLVALDLPTTYGSNPSLQSSEPLYSAPSPPLFEEDNFQGQIRQTWLQAQSKRPLQNWVRFLGQTWGTTPHMSQVVRASTQHYPDNLKE